MKCFYLDQADFNDDIAAALSRAIAYALAAGNAADIHRIVIIAPTNKVVTTVNQLLSQSTNYRATLNGFTVIGSNMNINVNSIANYNRFDNDAVIYFGLESKEILEIEEAGPVQLEIALKEYVSIDLWKGTWDAVNITHTVSFRSSDEDLVKKYIRTLNALEPTLVNPDEVFAYVKREKHWTLALCNLIQDWISVLITAKHFMVARSQELL